MKLLTVLSLLVLSSVAHAELIMRDYCFKLPRVMGGDAARVRARFYVEKDKQGTRQIMDLLTVEAPEGKVFAGSRGDASPASVSDGSLPSTIHLALGKEFILGDMTMVESVKFVATLRKLDSSQESNYYNRLVKEQTGIDPKHPVLRVVDPSADSEDAIRLEVVGSECTK